MPILSPMELDMNDDHNDSDSDDEENTTSTTDSTSAADDHRLHRRSRRRQRRRDHRPQQIPNYEIEDEEFDEALGLLLGHPSSIANHHHHKHHHHHNHNHKHHHRTDFEEETPQGRQNSVRAWVWWILTMGVVAIFSWVLHHQEHQWQKLHPGERLPPVYKCSATGSSSSSGESSAGSGHNHSKMMMAWPPVGVADTETVLPTVSTHPADTTEYSLEQLQENLRPWTAQQIAPYLLRTDEDTSSGVLDHHRVFLLESSSHTSSLSLVLTLQLLEEQQAATAATATAASHPPPTQLWVYGNDRDPFPSSFSFLRQGDGDGDDNTLQHILPNVRLGILCANEDAPQKDLSYVPADTFDMVFTGYLPPLRDPLGLDVTAQDWTARYQEICQSDDEEEEQQQQQQHRDEHHGSLLNDSMQRAQESWFARWVGDMARAVRPGGLLMIENLSAPYCEGFHDNGGVSRNWWSTIVQEMEHEWNVDPKSLRIGDDHLRGWRYHVAMKKKKRRERKR